MVESISIEPRVIKDVEAQDFERSTKMFRTYLKIDAGGATYLYPAVSLTDATARWSVNLELDHLNESTKVNLIVRSFFRVLGHAETTISDLFEGEREDKVIPLYAASSSSAIASLRISCSTDTNVVLVKNMIQTLAEVDRVADVAWSFLSRGISVLRKKQYSDRHVVDLYSAMFSAYTSASRNEVLKDRESLRSFYELLFRQTVECGIFIEGYMAKNAAELRSNTGLLRRAVAFQRAFSSLHSSTAQEVAVVSLGVQEFVNPLRMQELLHRLQPSVELGPRSQCLQGTRVKTINTLMAWIAKCNGSVLWCNGTSGSGKSSLLGTLHDLALYASGRNRLGAFIRYDRIENPDSSRLIVSIAHSLGMFDSRIGTEISRVVSDSASTSRLLALSPKEQFELLLEQPLKNIPSLAEEGPLIVIIDGLDECDTSEKLLTILNSGFGPSLPFMRLVISTRHMDRLVSISEQRMTEAATIVTLDTSSEDTIHDIQTYIDSHLSSLFAELSARNDSSGFQEICNAIHAKEILAKRANGSFIWAATACRFMSDLPSISRLIALARLKYLERDTNLMPSLYGTILRSIVAEAVQDKEAIRQSIRAVLGTIMAPGTPGPMNVKALDTLISLPGNLPVQLILAKLGAVVHTSSDGFVRLFHMSFYDFLRDRGQCGEEWYIDIEEQKKRLDGRYDQWLTEDLVNCPAPD